MAKLIDDVFKRFVFDQKKLLNYGFQQTESGVVFEQNFLNDSFKAVISVKDGQVSGQVIDLAANEEFFLIDVPSAQGEFINTVRLAYQELLVQIRDACCVAVLFASAQANRIARQIKAKYQVDPDFPWNTKANADSGVFRHPGSGKWFGLIMNIEQGKLTKQEDDRLVDVLNLKSDSRPIDQKSVFPAYHMNHQQWISVILNDQLSDEAVMKMVEESYALTE